MAAFMDVNAVGGANVVDGERNFNALRFCWLPLIFACFWHYDINGRYFKSF
jgi:hypothetical protein